MTKSHKRLHIPWFHLYELSHTGKSTETKSDKRLLGTEEREEWEVTPNGHSVSFWDDENILKLVVMIAQLCEYIKNHWIVHFRRVNFMVCEVYLSKAVIEIVHFYSPIWAAITLLRLKFVEFWYPKKNYAIADSQNYSVWGC